MRNEMVSEERLRQFLLAEVDDEERQRIESLYITDSLSRDVVIDAEEQLIDDYFDDRLTAAERQKFLSQYTETDLQRRRLRITESVRDWAEKHGSPVVASEKSSTSGFSGLWTRLQLRPVFLFPLTTAIVALLVLAGIWLFRNGGATDHLAIQQQIQQLNAASDSTVRVPVAVSLSLPPVAVRSSEPKPEIAAQPGVAELRLLWIRKQQYPAFRALIRRVANKESFNVNNLHSDEEKRIVLKLPIGTLVRGSYTIELNGVDEDGNDGVSEEYGFRLK
jgi:hypothetical protein